MQFFPAALQNLADQFARLPGIGGKTAQRLAFHVLSLPMDQAEEFAQAILEAKQQVHTCPRCQNLTDREICPICDDDTRDKSIICVVAEPRDVIAMERSREFRGVYHVLHGVISPLNHVTQDDIRIKERLLDFLNRVPYILLGDLPFTGKSSHYSAEFRCNAIEHRYLNPINQHYAYTITSRYSQYGIRNRN